MIQAFSELKKSSFYTYFIILVTVMATFSIAIESAETGNFYSFTIFQIERILFGVLTIDYFFHILEALQLKRCKIYLQSFEGFVDFIAVVPFVLTFFDFQNIEVVKYTFGIATFLKIARFSDALTIFKDVIISERKSILASLYLMFLLTFFISTILYFVEKEANPKGFGSIIESMWWSIVTLATVGYGDVVPITVLGKLVGALASIIGLGMFALPAGILANGFAQELKRVKYVTSWNLVAKVPIFSELDKGTISEIARLLMVKRFTKNEVIIKKGDVGDAMYFLLEGEVEVVFPEKEANVILNKGDFFGEIALIKDVKRTATVKAKKRCEMFELTSYDFKKLVQSKPEIIKVIESVSKDRFDLL
ncbi:cyclic nucleotide-gated ion channel [Polaribacter sp.]|uniref:cyclic nucleotide-gated ion channel n=1 Tax=Polaribacter sp. TaxID=1920175 RepID=UPI003EF1E791